MTAPPDKSNRCPASPVDTGKRLWFPVLWFFVLAYGITGIGMWVNSLALPRLPGMEINFQTLPWLRYAPYVLWAGPCLAGLLMTLLWGELSSASEKNVFLLNALLFVFFFLFVFLPPFIGSPPLVERRPRGLA